MKKGFLSTVVTVLGLELEDLDSDEWRQGANHRHAYVYGGGASSRCPHCRDGLAGLRETGVCHECGSSPFAPPSGFGSALGRG